MCEDNCREIMRGILVGINHIHNNSYLHRDIKPSNIVFKDENDLQSCKIIDFGLAVKLSHPGETKNETCGTLIY